MSDAYFDGLRDQGLYPPKGWGWSDLDRQKEKAGKMWKLGNRDPWLVEFVEENLADLLNGGE